MKLHIATPDTYEEVLQAVKDRDYQDMNREVEPLRQAEDAILMDSTNMTIDEEVEAVLKIVEEKL
jgi:cytidylate kinase